jgi:ubiquinone/menaquinone biosynthesis C-methylase UbiE
MAPVTAALLDALGPQPEDVVLELAAGTGDVAAALAGRVARVVATELSPAMVEAARRRGLEGVEHRVMDLQALDLPDASVDAIACRFGFMLVPDPARALREARRVLRPGGRLAFATWAPARRNPWATAFGPVLLERGLMEPPQPGAPGQFALGEPEELESLVRTAGFEGVTVREVEVEARYAGWEDYRRTTTALAVSLRETLAGLDPATRGAVDDAARARIARYRTAGGYALPGVALVTAAT